MLRTVVVGASTGLGRCIATGLSARGGHVALLARSKDKLDEAAAEAGNGALAIACDVTDQASCQAAIAAAAEGLGGIDSIIYTAAIGSIGAIEDTSADVWRRTFDTNVLGASFITAAALPHLKASHGRAIYFSTVGVEYTAPWSGLGVYQVTKAALQRLIVAYRNEHPAVAFTQLTMGECGGGTGDSQSQFNATWDRAEMMKHYPIWAQKGLMNGALMDIDHVVNVIHTLVTTGASVSIPEIILASRVQPPAS